MENVSSEAVSNSRGVNSQAKLKLQSLWSLPIMILNWVPHYFEIKINTD